MKVEPGNFCPLIKGPCVGAKCAWWTTVHGTNPQTGAPVDEAGCAIGWLPVLLIENAKETRQAAAAVESSRNEAKTDAEKSQAIQIALGNVLTHLAQPPALSGPKED
jgi:hypothetical protein